jgi:hypothetical protein
MNGFTVLLLIFIVLKLVGVITSLGSIPRAASTAETT